MRKSRCSRAILLLAVYSAAPGMLAGCTNSHDRSAGTIASRASSARHTGRESLRPLTPTIQSEPLYRTAERKYAHGDYVGAENNIEGLLSVRNLSAADLKFLQRQKVIAHAAVLSRTHATSSAAGA